MRWSWRLGRLAGIDVKVHATFALVLVWVGLNHWLAGRGLGGVLSGISFILLLFGCVVLHELGHALAARRFGVRTRDIILLPIGGLARLEHIPDKPYQELWIAAAGPAVNVVIAIVLSLWLRATGTWEPLSTLSMTDGPTLERLGVLNVFLVVFNLIPAFPMDGGRMLRAVLALRLEYTRATRIAARIGRGLAYLFGFLGLFTNPFLVFIALFVWIGASQEANLVQIRSALGGIPVWRVMVTEFHTLEPSDPLARAVELTLKGSQQDFPVLEAESLVGVLTHAGMLERLSERGDKEPVSSAMRHDWQQAEPAEMIGPVFRRLQERACRTVPVVEGGRLVGMVTMENVGEFLAIQAALKDG